MSDVCKLSFYANFSTILLTTFSSPAFAQSTTPVSEPTIISDEVSVNLISGSAVAPELSISIGEVGVGALPFNRTTNSPEIMYFGTWPHDYTSAITDGSYTTSTGGYGGLNVSFGRLSSRFPTAGGDAEVPNGSTLTSVPGAVYGSDYTYISGDGAVATFPSENVNCQSEEQAYFPLNVGSVLLRPNGEKITIAYERQYYLSAHCLKKRRIKTVTNSYGFMLIFSYASDDVNSNSWYTISSVREVNTGVDYCNPVTGACNTFTQNWPKVIFSDGNVTEPSGVSITLSPNLSMPDGSETLGVDRNGVRVADFTFTYDYTVGLQVTKFKKAGQEWAYTYTWPTPETLKISRTDPLGNTISTQSEKAHGKLLSVVDALQRKTTYQYYSNWLLKNVISPEATVDASGNPTAGYTNFVYDARGNVMQTTSVPKSGSGLPNRVTYASYPATCTERKICNKPVWIKDALLNETDYTYYASHGGVSSVMRPAPNAGAPRPLTLTTYAQRYAWVKNAADVLVQTSDPVWVVSTVTECQTAAGSNSPACDGSAPQTLTTYEYGAAGTREALLVKGVVISSGGTTLRTCYGYDVLNRRISETKPNANLGACP